MKNPRLPDLKLLKSLNFENENFNCLDIGANTGQFYLAFKEIFPKSNVLMIEANPHCERRLKKLGTDYVIVGISNKTGTLELISTKQKPYSKGASFYKEINLQNLKEDDLLKIQVPVNTLDNLFFDKKFEFIKIDVQGSELDVINGGPITLSKTEYVLIEVSLTEYNENAPLADKIVKSMSDLNFTIESIIDTHLDQKGNVIQLDILFSKNNQTHNYQIVEQYKDQLGL